MHNDFVALLVLPETFAPKHYLLESVFRVSDNPGSFDSGPPSACSPSVFGRMNAEKIIPDTTPNPIVTAKSEAGTTNTAKNSDPRELELGLYPCFTRKILPFFPDPSCGGCAVAFIDERLPDYTK